MFGRRYFSARYFGPRYFGDGDDTEVIVEPVPQPVSVSAGIGSLHPRKAQRTAAPPRRRFYDYDTDQDAPRRKVAARAPQKLRIVHETVQITAAEPVQVTGAGHVDVTEQVRIRVRGRVETRVSALAVSHTEHVSVTVAGAVLVECLTRDITIEERNPWQTVRYDNENLAREIETARSEKARLSTELAQLKRDREALQVLLLAA
jgi:hypothetical protein